MIIEDQRGISRKSRGILYQLKIQLNKRNISLKYHIGEIFQFQKRQFTKKQFFAIIQKYDKNLMLSQLDNLFDELDQSRNERVALSQLQRVFQTINQNDNPTVIDRNQVIRTANQKNRQKIGEVLPILAEIRKLMLYSEQVVEILYLFASQNGGIITKQNLNDILVNLDYNNYKNKDIFFNNILQGKQTIALFDFLQKLDLNSSARRSSVSFRSCSEIKSMKDVNQSQFIKQRMKESKIEETQFLKLSTIKSISNDGNQYVELENVPESLRPYYNYGSELEPIFSHVARQYIQTQTVFIDIQNPPYSMAYQWVHLAQTQQNYVLFQKSSSVIYRQKNRKGLGQLLQTKDIIQGNLGDCYLLSAIAGIVQKYPELVYRLYVLQKNPSHIYGVRLFIQGSWKTIIMDSCFPINRHRAFCAAQPYNNQIWVMLLEKAWAKVYGSYDNIHSGYNEEGLNALSGAPSIHVSAQQNQFIKRLQVQINRGSVITIATSSYVRQLSKMQQDNLGIFQNHAYSVLNVYSGLKSKDNENLTLIKIRNPWGRKQWQGSWSYKSGLWTKQLRQKVDYMNNPNDGSFFMSKQDFTIYFDHVNICRVNLAFRNSWIEIQSDRQQFKSVKIKVKERGDYYFTLYQQNPRRYSGKNYEKSKSWIFLYEYKHGRVNAIGSSSSNKTDNTLQVTLQKGQYMIISKIQWKLWESHRYTLSSYGPQRVSFSKQQFKIHDISNFIESKAKLGFGQKSFYGNANILKRWQFNPEQGYGFILINNQQNNIFKTQITFDYQHGLKILQPYSLPIRLQIYPGEQVICKFIVDPSGYGYNLKQRHNYQYAY